MVVDLTRFPYNGLANVRAATLTEAIASEPVSDGFVVVTLKAGDASALIAPIRAFAQQLRLAADDTGFRDITACRQVNFAHADSVKHFLLSMIFDPNFLEDIERCYEGRGFAFPHPFFCKMVAV